MSVLKQKFDSRVDSFYTTARSLVNTDLAPERAMFQQLFARSLLKGILAVVVCWLGLSQLSLAVWQLWCW